MSRYVAECQALGFLCDWEAASGSRPDAVAALLQHINRAHGTGATSPTLSALIDRYVTEIR